MPSGRRRGQEGYTLAGLAMIITVMTIMVAAILPLWSSRVIWDREEELISRGLQIAEAIRVFQTRFGRLPNRLEELVEVEPRCLRRLYDDPMTEHGGWAVLVEIPGGGVLAVDSRTGQPLVPVDTDGDGVPDPPPPPASPPPDGGTVAVGPIHGVKSLGKGDAQHLFFDSEDFGDWEFSIEILQKELAKPGENGLLPRTNALVLGRPFRYPPPGQIADVDPNLGGATRQPPQPGPRPPRPGGGPGRGPGGRN